jgi:hypothetical protein
VCGWVTPRGAVTPYVYQMSQTSAVDFAKMNLIFILLIVKFTFLSSGRCLFPLQPPQLQAINRIHGEPLGVLQHLPGRRIIRAVPNLANTQSHNVKSADSELNSDAKYVTVLKSEQGNEGNELSIKQFHRSKTPLYTITFPSITQASFSAHNSPTMEIDFGKIEIPLSRNEVVSVHIRVHRIRLKQWFLDVPEFSFLMTTNQRPPTTQYSATVFFEYYENGKHHQEMYKSIALFSAFKKSGFAFRDMPLLLKGAPDLDRIYSCHLQIHQATGKKIEEKYQLDRELLERFRNYD